MQGSNGGAPVAVLAVRPLDHLELLERTPRADGNTGQGRLGDVRGYVRLLAHTLVEAVEQGPAAREHHPAVHDVGCEFGRSAVERHFTAPMI